MSLRLDALAAEALAAEALAAEAPDVLAADVLAADALIVGGIDLKVVIAGFLVGVVVGITGMGGGALMTPALIFLGVGDAATVVTADLTAAAIYKTSGAAVHWREGSPHLRLALWLIAGSVPTAFLGPFLLRWILPAAELDDALKVAIGFALLVAASTYALRLYIQLRRVRGGQPGSGSDPVVRPVPTLLVGAIGGLLVGITSVGSGSVIMISLLMLYPTLTAVKLVGTDLVQAVPLVLAAAIANIVANGLDWGVLVPLVIGSVPGSIVGARIAPKVPASVIRRGIVIVLTMSGLALLDNAGWAPLGAGEEETYPVLIGGVGVAMVLVLPLVWGLLRRTQGMPMFGTPTVAELEEPGGGRRGKRAAARGTGKRAARRAAKRRTRGRERGRER